MNRTGTPLPALSPHSGERVADLSAVALAKVEGRVRGGSWKAQDNGRAGAVEARIQVSSGLLSWLGVGQVGRVALRLDGKILSCDDWHGTRLAGANDHSSHRRQERSLRIRKAPQAIVRTEEQFTVRRSERRVGGFVDGVSGEHLKPGTGPQHEHVTPFVRHVNFSIGQEH